MAPLPSRKSLESMKRVDLQRLCKDYGVKANLKSEALIDLLIDTAKPPVISTLTRRSVSTRQSSRAGPSRISSIVIHDTDKEEDGTDANNNTHDQGSVPASTSHQERTPPLATRTRKRKEQTRLGVGRPVVAGGTGPRAVTKSLSFTKGKRGKTRGTLKSTEATILEEIEQDNHIATQDIPDEVTSQEACSSEALRQHTSPEASIDSLATIDKHVADALRPLYEQMRSMKSELELMQALKTEVGELKARIDEIGSLKEKVESLTATVRDLRKEAEEAVTLRLDSSQPKGTLLIQGDSIPSTPKMQSSARENRTGSSFGAPQLPVGTALRQSCDSLFATDSSTNAGPHPGFAPSMLGKRHRDSAASELVVNRESDRTLEEIARMKPSRKRAKISVDNDDLMDIPNEGAIEGTTEDDLLEQEGSDDAFRGPSFRVFSGLEVSPLELTDPPPPTESLPDFFAISPLASEAPIIPRQGNRATSTANATENQQPFAFSFQHTISSTPAHGMFMPSFPYPEPPQSPSPAGTSTTGLLNQQSPERSDVFQAFGLPPPGRSSRTTGLRSTSGLTSSFIDPATLIRPPSNNSETSETGTRPVDPSSSTGDLESSHMKRTMYGTELDGDTRFGDFGLEGVGNAKGRFWAGGRF